MLYFDILGKRCCVVVVDQLVFFVFFYYRGWKVIIRDFLVFFILRVGYVLVKKMQENVFGKVFFFEQKVKVYQEKSIFVFCFFIYFVSFFLERGCDVGCVVVILRLRGDKYVVESLYRICSFRFFLTFFFFVNLVFLGMGQIVEF